MVSIPLLSRFGTVWPIDLPLHPNSRISQLKGQLQSLQHGSMSCSDLLLQVKSLADQLSIAGKPIGDDDLISAINCSLNPSYYPFYHILYCSHSATVNGPLMSFKLNSLIVTCYLLIIGSPVNSIWRIFSILNRINPPYMPRWYE